MKKRILSLVLCAVMLLSMCLFMGAGVTQDAAEAAGEVPQTAVFTEAGPFRSAVSVRPQPLRAAADRAAGGDGLELSKEVTANGSGYTVHLEAYTTGTVTTTTSIAPCDIVLVLDQSGSMAYNFDGNETSTDSARRQYAMKQAVNTFIEAVADKPISFYAFEILYWCGVRMGELLALTPADFDFQACTIRINKSYQRLEGKDIVTDPKTVKSNRMITMPEFLSEELEAYIGMLYGLNENDRIFQISKSYLHHEMDRGVKLSGVKRIRIHDLRHSHVSLLINMGYSAVAIGERVGHESVEITYRYAHLFPAKGKEIADKLNIEREEIVNVA